MSGALIAGLYQKLGRGMIELVGAQGFDDAQIVNHPLQMRQPVGNPGAVFSGLMKRELRAQHLGYARDKGEPFALEERFRTVMAAEPRELRLVVEQLELAGRA